MDAKASFMDEFMRFLEQLPDNEYDVQCCTE